MATWMQKGMRVLRLARLDAGYRKLALLVLGAVLNAASFIYTRYRERILGSVS